MRPESKCLAPARRSSGVDVRSRRCRPMQCSQTLSTARDGLCANHTQRPRVVVDPAVLMLALLRGDRECLRVLRRVADRAVVPLVSAALLMEYRAVLQAKASRGGSERSATIRDVLSAFANASIPIAIDPHWHPRSLDPRIDRLLQVAVMGAASAIITRRLRAIRGIAPRCGVRLLVPREIDSGAKERDEA
jgi:putative PIN family toxin of toxin-antitoxin system